MPQYAEHDLNKIESTLAETLVALILIPSMFNNNIAWNPKSKGKITKSGPGFELGTFGILAGRSATELLAKEKSAEKHLG